jgi:zinc transporter
MSSRMQLNAPAYGADPQGLICGYECQADAPAQPLGSEAAARWIAQPPASGFLWLHFNLSQAGTEPWLRAHAQLDDEFFEALHRGSRSTRIERDGHSLLGVVNDVTFDFSFDPSDVATLWVSVRERVVISGRRQPLRSVDRLRADVNRGERLATPVAVLDHLFRDQADELQRIARTATERLDDIEDALLAGKPGRHATELARLRRLTVRLQRLLAPEPAALMRLLGNPPAWVPAHDLEQLRQASEEFAVVLRDISALQERIKLLQDEASARVADENNRSLFILTMVTVLALPINLIAGLLGMNVGGIPLTEHAHGFWVVVLVVALVSGALAWFTVRRLAPLRTRSD